MTPNSQDQGGCRACHRETLIGKELGKADFPWGLGFTRAETGDVHWPPAELLGNDESRACRARGDDAAGSLLEASEGWWCWMTNAPGAEERCAPYGWCQDLVSCSFAAADTLFCAKCQGTGGNCERGGGHGTTQLDGAPGHGIANVLNDVDEVR